MKLANIAKSSEEKRFAVILNKRKYTIIQDIRPGINAAVRAWEDMSLYFIKLFYLILVFIVINAVTMSNLRAEYSILRNENTVEISGEVYSTVKTVLTQFQKLDGRESLLRKLQFANKLKKPYLTPLKKGFDLIDKSPIGKQLDLIDKGFAIIKATDEFAQWATGKDTSPTAFTDSIVELSAFDPTGLSSIAKSQVYDRIVEINNKMDEIRENEQKADEAFKEMSSIFLGEEFILSIASKLNYENVQTEEDAEKLVAIVHERYRNAITSAITLLNQHIQGIKSRMPNQRICLGLCVAQMEEAASRIRGMSGQLMRLSSLLNENHVNEMWDAVGGFIAADTAAKIEKFKGEVIELSSQVEDYRIAISKNEEIPERPIDQESGTGDGVNNWNPQLTIVDNTPPVDHKTQIPPSHDDRAEDEILKDIPKIPNHGPWLANLSGAHSTVASTFAFNEGGEIKNGPLNTGDNITIRQVSVDRNRRRVNVNGRVKGAFDYTAWGEWAGNLRIFNPGTGHTVRIKRGYFVTGSPTPSSFISSNDARRIGKATFLGRLYGDYTAPGGGGVQAGAITGSSKITADFVKRDVTAKLIILNNRAYYATGRFNGKFAIENNSIAYGGALTGSNLNFGGINGGFTGPKAQETGGTFYYFKNDGSLATGVYTAKR